MVHKKSVLTTVLFFLFVSMMFAAPISKKTAEQAALNWMSYYSGKNVDNITIKNVTSTEYKGSNVLYTFTFKEGGFVIVAGDDQAYPILGYDTESKADMKDMPVQMNDWIDQYSKEINQIRIEKFTDKEAEQEWKNILNNDFSAYETDKWQYGPFIYAKWNQGSSWNELCPYDSDGPGNHAYAGCVAVAMAQVMKKWNHPSYGNGSHGYYCDYGWLSANFYYNYYFYNMSNYSANYYSRRLLLHCGIAVNMDYGPDGSGASMSRVDDAFEDYFRYSTSAKYRQKIYHTSGGWNSLIMTEMYNSRPLVYRGTSSFWSGGHAFNLDGAKTNDYFHFNFGWGGSWNGWFKLSSIKPGGSDLTKYQAGIFEIKPLSKGEEKSGNGEEKSEIAENEIYQVTDLVQIYPNPFSTETIISYALHKAGNVSLEIYSITGQLVYTLVNGQKPAGQHTIQWDANDSNGNKMQNGTYFIRLQTEDNTQTTKVVLMQ